MFRKTLIASATAGLLAVGALSATAGPANAANYNLQIGSQGVQLTHYRGHQPRRYCKPVFKRVHWRDYWGRTYWKVVKVGERCFKPRYYSKPQWDYGRRHQGYGRRHQGSGFTFQYSW